uniref:Glyco_transf_7N domain-containing protein n=1 Tax=Macrostomum lignano TaxID=282301 RepID=A0A1I8FA35_9PLAT
RSTETAWSRERRDCFYGKRWSSVCTAGQKEAAFGGSQASARPPSNSAQSRAHLRNINSGSSSQMERAQFDGPRWQAAGRTPSRTGFPPGPATPSQAVIHAPSDCSPGKSVLILVPYRQREQHLAALLSYLHPYSAAAAALLQHCGWRAESVRQLRRFDCVVFHDVDLLPTNPFVPYNCPAYPPAH